MRRLATVLAASAAILWVAAPASAFAHDKVANPYLHAAFDVLTLAVATAPVWTAYFWVGRRMALLALVGIVQLPVAIIGFVPFLDPVWHGTALVGALALTLLSLMAVRRLATARTAEVAAAPAAAAPH